MTDSSLSKISFPRRCGRRVEADFAGGDISSNGGALLLSASDRRLGLLSGLARRLDDRRQAGKVDHRLLPLLRQRVYAVALGYEDVNDHDGLRDDLALQTACGRAERLASASTVGRLDRAADRAWAWAAHERMVEAFIASFDGAPKELVLDFDATDDTVHGGQEGRFFHGYYKSYCFLPLYVFCGEQLLARNPRLAGLAEQAMGRAAAAYRESGEKQRLFAELRYGARTWSRRRRVIARLEHGPMGANPRYVVTNLPGDGQQLYDRLYCQRGEMENRIKECQLNLFADRTSCHDWWPNQFRLILSSLAYVLIEAIRRLALNGTDMARAQAGTIRLRLLRIGAVVIRNSRRIRFHLSTACPDKSLFRLVADRLKPG